MKKIELYLFVFPAVLLILIFGIYPLIYNINLSFKDINLISYISGTSPFVGFANYIRLFNEPVFKRMLLNTLIFTVLSIAFQFIIGFLLALLFNRNFPLKVFLQSLIMIPWILPIIVSGSFFRWLFNDEGLLNSILLSLGLINRPIPWITSSKLSIISVTLANIWLGIPFNFILLYTGLQNIPIELYESADIDGASSWQKVLYISLPMLKPVIIALLTLGCIFTIKVFDLVWIVNRGGPGDVSHLFSTLSYSLAFDHFRFGLSAGVLIIMLLIVITLVIILNLIKLE